jgi:hypothetical protein
MFKAMFKAVFSSPKYLAGAVCLGVSLWFSAPTQAQPAGKNITLSPNFAPDPQQWQGTSNGASPAKAIANRGNTPTSGSCAGYVSDQPGHTLTLKAFFDYLKIQVQSSEDTTLVIRGPGGTWCNDDDEGKNAGLAGQWLPGTYQIWVGSYKPDQPVPYVLRISEQR